MQQQQNTIHIRIHRITIPTLIATKQTIYTIRAYSTSQQLLTEFPFKQLPSTSSSNPIQHPTTRPSYLSNTLTINLNKYKQSSIVMVVMVDGIQCGRRIIDLMAIYFDQRAKWEEKVAIQKYGTENGWIQMDITKEGGETVGGLQPPRIDFKINGIFYDRGKREYRDNKDKERQIQGFQSVQAKVRNLFSWMDDFDVKAFEYWPEQFKSRTNTRFDQM